MSDSNQEKSYFDILTNVKVGYMNDIRLIDPKKFGGKGVPYYSLRIAGLHGESSDVKYIKYNANVLGSAAIEIIEGPILNALQEAVVHGRKPEDVKVIANILLGDVEPKLFFYKTGEKKGEPGVTMQGGVLTIKHLTIDGNKIDLSSYNTESADNSELNTPEQSNDPINNKNGEPVGNTNFNHLAQPNGLPTSNKTAPCAMA